MAEVFISYARKDKAFVEQLSKMLNDHGRETWIDLEDIPPLAVWRKEIQAAIEEADNFVFVISPDSVKSDICKQELEHAVVQHKRLLPIVWQDVEGEAVPNELEEINWIWFSAQDDFNAGFRSLIEAFDTDLNWVKDHTRYLVRARVWEEKGKDHSLLLRGRDLEEAEEWLAKATEKEPKPTPLQTQYIPKSRKAETKRQRTIGTGITIALIVAIALAIVAFVQRQEAERTTAGLLEEQGRQVLIEGRADQAIVYFSEALRLGVDTPVLRYQIAEAWRATEARHKAFGAGIRSFVLSPDGSRIATLNDNGKVRVWNTSTFESVKNLNTPGKVSGIKAFGPQGETLLLKFGRPTVIWDVTQDQAEATFDLKHDGPGALLALSANGDIAITASADETVRLWQLPTKELLAEFQHNGDINDLTVSPHGRRAISSSWDRTAKLIDLETHMLIKVLEGHERAINTSIFSPDETMVVTCSSDDTARVWSALDGTLIRILTGHNDSILFAAFSMDGRKLVTTSLDGTAIVWDPHTGQKFGELSGHNKPIRFAEFSGDASRILTVGDDRTARIWNTIAKTQIYMFPSSGLARFCRRAECVISIEGQEASIWDLKSLPLKALFAGHTDEVVSFAFDKEGRRLVTASDDHTARIWSTLNGSLLYTLAQHKYTVVSAKFSPDGKLVATGCKDSTAYIWSAQSGNWMRKLDAGGEVIDVLFSAQGRKLLTLARGSARIWDTHTGNLLVKLKVPNMSLLSAVFSSDGKRVLARRSDNVFGAWRVSDGVLLFKHNGDGHGITSVAFNQDRRTVVSGSTNGVVWVIEGATGKIRERLNSKTALKALSLSPSGQEMAIETKDGKVHLWDLGRLKHVGVIEGQHPVFSADGSRIATVYGTSIMIYSTQTSKLLSKLTGNSGRISQCIFGPIGDLFATIDGGYTRLWNVGVDRRGANEILKEVSEKAVWRLVDGNLLPK